MSLWLRFLTIKIQSEEGLKSEDIDEETESYDNMRQKRKRVFGRGFTDDKKFEIGKFYIDLAIRWGTSSTEFWPAAKLNKLSNVSKN